MKKFLVCSIRKGSEKPVGSGEFGIEDELQFARLVSVRPRASFRRGSRVGQDPQWVFPEPIDHLFALVPAEDLLDDVSLVILDETD